MEYEKSFTDALQFIWGQGFLSPGGPEEVAVILQGTDITGQRVLDIGSGLGGIDLLLVQAYGAGHVTGIDVEPDLVRQATALAQLHGLSDRCAFQTVTPGALPFADASFDLVFSKDAMVHVADKLGLYREILRVLRPGGQLRAGDWFWATGAEQHPAVKAWLGAGPLHFVFTTPDAARAALVAAGLQQVAIVDRRDALQVSNRALIARLHGPDFRQLVDLVGEANALSRRDAAGLRQAALDDGQLIPCHLLARRAEPPKSRSDKSH